MDTTQWAQGIGLLKKPLMEEEGELVHSSSLLISNNNNNSSSSAIRAPIISHQVVERKARPQKEQALHCPRCNSTNTKFCYYNNYSLTQPRYFCKTCRRYWTEGGSLRNVPVGGGSRKNKKHSSNSNPNPSSSSSSAIKISASVPTNLQPFDQVQDLNLGFLNSSSMSSGGLSAMELLRSTGITARGLGMPMSMPMTMPGVPESDVLHGSTVMFPFDRNMEEGGRRLLFPFGEMKQEQHRGQGGEPPMFWNGMMGGGGGSW